MGPGADLHLPCWERLRKEAGAPPHPPPPFLPLEDAFPTQCHHTLGLGGVVSVSEPQKRSLPIAGGKGFRRQERPPPGFWKERYYVHCEHCRANL